MITPQCLAEINHAPLEVSLIILACVSPLIVVSIVYYLKKRLEHRQIIAAIEKGISLSEIMPAKPQLVGPAWIKSVSTAVAMTIIGLGVIWSGGFAGNPEVIVGFALFGVGAGWLTRGILYRKYHPQDKAAEETPKPEE